MRRDAGLFDVRELVYSIPRLASTQPKELPHHGKSDRLISVVVLFLTEGVLTCGYILGKVHTNPCQAICHMANNHGSNLRHSKVNCRLVQPQITEAHVINNLMMGISLEGLSTPHSLLD